MAERCNDPNCINCNYIPRAKRRKLERAAKRQAKKDAKKLVNNMFEGDDPLAGLKEPK